MPQVRALMVSFADFHGYRARINGVTRLGIRKYLRIPENVQVFLDNGAFHTLLRGDELNPAAYQKFIEISSPDWYPIPAEFIPHPKMRVALQEQLFRKTTIYNTKYAPKGFVPVVHAGKCLPKFLDSIERMEKKNSRPVTRLGLGAMVPFLLRGKGADGRFQVVDDIMAVRKRLPNARIHGFGIGGTATLHIAALLGLDSVDSSGWRNRAARGIIQLRGTGDRIIGDFGKWRGRPVSLQERKDLRNCACPSCSTDGPKMLEAGKLAGFAARATHNLWVLTKELSDIETQLKAGTYRDWYQDHMENRIFTKLVEHSLTLLHPPGSAPRVRIRSNKVA